MFPHLLLLIGAGTSFRKNKFDPRGLKANLAEPAERQLVHAVAMDCSSGYCPLRIRTMDARHSMLEVTLAKKFALMDSKAANKLIPFLIGLKPDVYLKGVEAMEKGRMMRREADDKGDIAERLQRLETIRKTDRLASIGEKAAPYLNDDADPNDVHANWRESFIAKASLIADTDMQEAWGRILASELNGPGAFSMQTVAIVADMGPQDAAMFANLCRYVCLLYDKEANTKQHLAIVFDSGMQSVYTALSFAKLGILESLGLITQHPYAVSLNAGRHLDFVFGNKLLSFTASADRSGEIECGRVSFTRAGKELARIVDAEPDPRFVDFCFSHWSRTAKERGYAVHGYTLGDS